MLFVVARENNWESATVFGERIAETPAPFDGVVLYILGTPPVSAGEPLVSLGQLASPSAGSEMITRVSYWQSSVHTAQDRQSRKLRRCDVIITRAPITTIGISK